MAIHLGFFYIFIKTLLQFALQVHKPPSAFPMDMQSKCCNKLRVFIWLLLMDRLNTRNLLRRKNFKIEGNNYSCVLCRRQLEETAFHLFFECSFSRSCWESIGLKWTRTLPFFSMIQNARQSFNKPFFMEIFIIAAWGIWKQRNNMIFDQKQPSLHSWKKTFADEVLLQANRIKEDLRTELLEWTISVCPS